MASRGINKAIIIGNLGDKPEVRYTQNDVAVASFSVATSDIWNDKNTGEKKEATEWHRIVCYRGLAQVAGDYLQKGSKVYIEGQLKTRKWQGQDGQDRYTTEIIANELQMLDGRPESKQQGSQQGGFPSQTNNQQGQFNKTQQGGFGSGRNADLDDEIPF